MDERVGDSKPSRAPRATVVNAIGIAAAVVLAILAIISVSQIMAVNDANNLASSRYDECDDATTAFLDASDDLTLQSRMYVFTGRRQHLDAFIDEYSRSTRKDAVDTLESHLSNNSAHEELYNANLLSEELSKTELYAMRLAAEAYSQALVPELEEIQLKTEDAKRAGDAKLALAGDMLSGKDYLNKKNGIVESVEKCTSSLLDMLHEAEEKNAKRLDSLLARLRVLVLVLLAIVAILVFLNLRLVILPLAGYAKRMRAGDPLYLTGSQELRYVASAYNHVYEESKRYTALLKHEAETDPLTGLYNRGIYDHLLNEGGDLAMILVDVDYFKQVNDEHGHEKGDAVLRHVARALTEPFGPDDYVCRIGGDEFAVIMVGVTSDQKDTVNSKVEEILDAMDKDCDGLPRVTLSMGIAFGEDPYDRETLCHMADKALYSVKKKGRNSYAFYD